jgi:hypothetical protein
MPTEADTCRKWVLPKLLSAGWDDEQICEQRTITDGRIVPVGKGFIRKAPRRFDYLAAIVRTEWICSKLRNASRGVGARRERTRLEQFLQVELPMPGVEQQKSAERLFAEVDALKCLQAETAAQL